MRIAFAKHVLSVAMISAFVSPLAIACPNPGANGCPFVATQDEANKTITVSKEAWEDLDSTTCILATQHPGIVDTNIATLCQTDQTVPKSK